MLRTLIAARWRLLSPFSSTIAKNPNASVSKATNLIPDRRTNRALAAVVEIFRVVVAGDEPGFNTGGLNEQEEPVGKFAQAKDTLLTAPVVGTSVTW